MLKAPKEKSPILSDSSSNRSCSEVEEKPSGSLTQPVNLMKAISPSGSGPLDEVFNKVLSAFPNP